jgi:hypothetical protein
MPAARMIGMGMGDHRPINRAPRIDEKIAGFTIETLRLQGQQRRSSCGAHRDRLIESSSELIIALTTEAAIQ